MGCAAWLVVPSRTYTSYRTSRLLKYERFWYSSELRHHNLCHTHEHQFETVTAQATLSAMHAHHHPFNVSPEHSCMLCAVQQKMPAPHIASYGAPGLGPQSR